MILSTKIDIVCEIINYLLFTVACTLTINVDMIYADQWSGIGFCDPLGTLRLTSTPNR